MYHSTDEKYFSMRVRRKYRWKCQEKRTCVENYCEKMNQPTLWQRTLELPVRMGGGWFGCQLPLANDAAIEPSVGKMVYMWYIWWEQRAHIRCVEDWQKVREGSKNEKKKEEKMLTHGRALFMETVKLKTVFPLGIIVSFRQPACGPVSLLLFGLS